MLNKKFRFSNITAIILFIMVIAVFLLSFNVSLAQSPEVGMNYAANLELPSSDRDLRDLLVAVVRYFLTFLI